MWNSTSELVKKAVEIAKVKYPKGFNKLQLIECSKEVYGGFASNPFKIMETMQDVHDKGNYFSEIDGHYPRGMSACYVCGLSGQCGAKTCPAFKNGECKVEEPELYIDDLKEMIDDDEFSEDDLFQLLSNYPNAKEFEAVTEHFYNNR
jgi:hypothetical protein